MLFIVNDSEASDSHYLEKYTGNFEYSHLTSISSMTWHELFPMGGSLNKDKIGVWLERIWPISVPHPHVSNGVYNI